MQFASGDKINVAHLKRLNGAIPASYTVFKEGTTYYAESNVPGGTDYSGTNASTVLQNGIDALPNGGTVFIKTGTYILPSTVLIPSDITLKGEGFSSILKAEDNGLDLHLLQNKHYAVSYDDNIIIHDLTLDGNVANQNGGTTDQCAIRFYYIRNCLVNNVYGKNTKTTTLYFDHPTKTRIRNCIQENGTDGTGILYGYGSDRGVIEGNFLKGNGQVGIHLHSNIDTQVINNHSEQNQHSGIYVDSGSRNNILSGNICSENGQAGAGYGGITLADASYNLIVGNQCFDEDGTPTQTYGVGTAGSADYNTFKANQCRINLTQPYLMVGAHNTYDGKERTAISVDLSGAATSLVVFQSEEARFIPRATILFTEASTVDAGVTIEIGKANGVYDRDYYYTGTSPPSQSTWTNTQLTLLKNDVVAGDTVTFYSAGGKTGAGEIMLILDYLTL